MTGAMDDPPEAEFEDYSRTSKRYDQTRVPVGLEIILGCFTAGSVPLTEQHVLDGGCGTGNYLDGLRGRVGHLHGLERNEGMIAKARRKFVGESATEIRRGNLLDLPYEDDSMDGFMCNQVIHHLDPSRSTGDFPALRAMLREAYRVLLPGGVLVLNTCSQRQLFDGYWWGELIRPAIERMARRYCPLDSLTHILERTGFEVRGRIVPTDAILQGERYLDPEAPLDEGFRDGDSTWALLTADELHAALDRICTMRDEGSLSDYFEERERLRNEVGQCVFVWAVKPD